jgi:hypothetical protein
VFEEDPPPGQAARVGGLDVLLAERVDQLRAERAEQQGGNEEGHGDRRQGQAREVFGRSRAVALNREQAQVEAEEDDQDEAGEERWRRVAERGPKPDHVIGRAVAMGGRQHPEGHRHEDRQDVGVDDDPQRGPDLRGDQARHRLAVADRFAEVEVHRPADEGPVLAQQGPVEAELVVQPVDRRFRCVLRPEDDLRRIPGHQPDQDEGEDRDDQQGQQRLTEPLQHVDPS